MSKLNNTTPDTSVSLRSPAITRTYDAGSVISGEVVRHTFSFRNPLDDAISIADEQSDVKSSCGCTRAKISHHQLAKNQVTHIELEVNSDNKRGTVREFAEVAWTSRKGVMLTTQFQIEARVIMPIAFAPNELFFSKRDVAVGTVHQVVCTPDSALDWDQALFQFSEPYLRITDRRYQVDTNSLVLGITCQSTDQGTGRQAELKIWIPNPNSASSDSNAPLTATLAIASHDLATLKLTPSRVLLRPAVSNSASSQEAKRTFQATLIASGDVLEQDVQIVRVEADGLTIDDYTSHRISPDAVRITIIAQTNAPARGADPPNALEAPKVLQIEFSTGDCVNVGYRFPIDSHASISKSATKSRPRIDAENQSDDLEPGAINAAADNGTGTCEKTL